MFNIGNVGTRTRGLPDYPVLVFPPELTHLLSNTSGDLLVDISITPESSSEPMYTGLCNVIVGPSVVVVPLPVRNNDMLMEKASNKKEVENVHWKKPNPSVKSEAINIQKPKKALTSTINILYHTRNIQNQKVTQILNNDNEQGKSTKSQISRVILHNPLNSSENKQIPSPSMIKRELDEDSIDISKPKIQKCVHTKQINAPVNDFNSPTFHTNNTASNGLYKNYEEEEYACVLFLAQLAALKVSNDPQNVIPANDTVSKSNKPQTSMDNLFLKETSVTSTIGSTEERNSKKSVEQMDYDVILANNTILESNNPQTSVENSGLKEGSVTLTYDSTESNSKKPVQLGYDTSMFHCLFGMETAKSTSQEVSNGSYQCTHCKQHFPMLTEFRNHLVRGKTTNLTTTGNSRKYVNEKPTRHYGHRLNCKCINCRTNINHINYSQRPPNIFQCKDCKKIFLNFDEFSKHQMNTHSKFNCGNCKIFQCKDCKETFLNFDDFSNHQMNIHSKFNCGNCN